MYVDEFVAEFTSIMRTEKIVFPFEISNGVFNALFSNPFLADAHFL